MVNFQIVNFQINGQLPSKQDSHSKAKISDQFLPKTEIFNADSNYSMKASQQR